MSLNALDMTMQFGMWKRIAFFFFFMKNHISEINVFAEFHFVCVKKHHFLNKKVQLLCKKAQRKRHFLEFE